MIKLNLPQYEFRFLKHNNKTNIFDEFRKKYIQLTPEEWVRQNFLKFLTVEKKYPKSLTAVEVSLKINSLQKRADIVIYNINREIEIVVECKAPTVKISQDTCKQALIYNTSFNAKYIILTNGLTHFCIENTANNIDLKFLPQIPKFNTGNL